MDTLAFFQTQQRKVLGMIAVTRACMERPSKIQSGRAVPVQVNTVLSGDLIDIIRPWKMFAKVFSSREN